MECVILGDLTGVRIANFRRSIFTPIADYALVDEVHSVPQLAFSILPFPFEPSSCEEMREIGK